MYHGFVCLLSVGGGGREDECGEKVVRVGEGCGYGTSVGVVATGLIALPSLRIAVEASRKRDGQGSCKSLLREMAGRFAAVAR